MTRVICDQCRVETEPNQYGLSPNGWIRVTVRGKYPNGDHDYCSPACALEGLKGEVPPAVVVPAAAEPVGV